MGPIACSSHCLVLYYSNPCHCSKTKIEMKTNYGGVPLLLKGKTLNDEGGSLTHHFNHLFICLKSYNPLTQNSKGDHFPFSQGDGGRLMAWPQHD